MRAICLVAARLYVIGTIGHQLRERPSILIRALTSGSLDDLLLTGILIAALPFIGQLVLKDVLNPADGLSPLLYL